MRNVLKLFMVLCIALAGTAVFAQDIQTKGSIGGIVRDANGAALPGAKITVTGGQATRETTSGDDGAFSIENLTPGGWQEFERSAVPDYSGSAQRLKLVLSRAGGQ